MNRPINGERRPPTSETDPWLATAPTLLKPQAPSLKPCRAALWALVLAMALPAAALAGVVVNEVYHMSSSGSNAGEFIELYNSGAAEHTFGPDDYLIALSGCPACFYGAGYVQEIFPLDGRTIAAGGFLLFGDNPVAGPFAAPGFTQVSPDFPFSWAPEGSQLGVDETYAIVQLSGAIPQPDDDIDADDDGVIDFPGLVVGSLTDGVYLRYNSGYGYFGALEIDGTDNGVGLVWSGFVRVPDGSGSFFPTANNPDNPGSNEVIPTPDRTYPAPQPAAVAPFEISDCAVEPVTVTGTGLVPGATLTLTRAGEADITGTVDIWSGTYGTAIDADFFPSHAAPGLWNLEVSYPDAQTATLTDAVNVVADTACPWGRVGDLYVISTEVPRVLQFDGAIGDLVGSFVPGGSLGLGVNDAVSGLTFAPNGNLLLSTFGGPAGNGILEYDGLTGALVGEFVTLINFPPSVANGWLESPVDCIFGPDGNLYVVARTEGLVNKYDGQTGEWLGFFAIGGPGPGLDDPHVLRFAPNGNLLVGYGASHPAEPQFHGVAEFHGATGRLVRALGFAGGMDTGTNTKVRGLEFAPNGDLLAVEQEWTPPNWTFPTRDEVLAFDFASGAPLGTFIPDGAGGMGKTNRIMLAPSGNLLVDGLDTEAWGRVAEFDATSGVWLGTFAATPALPPCCEGLGSGQGFEFKPAPPDPLPAPVIAGVSVGQHDACNPLTGVTVSGANLDATATTIKLSRVGGEPPYPDYVGLIVGSSGDGASLTVDFDLDGGIIATGSWDVVAINPDGQSDTLAGAVQMTGCRSARSGNLLATVNRRRGNHTATGIIEYDGAQGDVVGWFTSDRLTDDIGAELYQGNGLAWGPNGNLFVAADSQSADPDARYVIEIDGVTGQRLGEFVPTGSGGLFWPYDLTFGPDGNLFVLHHDLPRPYWGQFGILEFDGLTGAFVRTVVELGSVEKSSKLIFGPNGNLYVSTESAGVVEFDPTTGARLGVFEGSMNSFFWPGIVFSPHTGNLLVHWYGPEAGEVLEFDPQTRALLGIFVVQGACGMDTPGSANGIEFGPDGNLYISSAGMPTGSPHLPPGERAFEQKVLRFDGWTGDNCAEFSFVRHSRGDPVYELSFVPIPGDGDGDWDVDLDDFARLQQCFGPGAPGPDDYWCLRFDFDRDGDVDADDIPGFAREFTGPQEPTPAPPGACCMPDDTCVEAAGPSECSLQYGGAFQGVGSDCASGCPGVGACCDPNNGTCTISTADVCTNGGGDYQGDGTDCATMSCPFGQYHNRIPSTTQFAVAGPGLQLADDMTLEGAGARELVFLDLAVVALTGGPFDVTVELWTDCPGDGGTLIPDTSFTWMGIPDDGDVHLLTVDPITPAVTIPDTVWMTATFTTPESGWIIAEQAETGTTADLYGWNNPWTCNNWFGGNPYAGFWANLRCVEGSSRASGDGQATRLSITKLETPLHIIPAGEGVGLTLEP